MLGGTRYYMAGVTDHMRVRPGEDPNRAYLMPAIVGTPWRDGAGTVYHDVLTLSVTYRAPAEAVERLLPPGFVVGAEPSTEALVTVSYARNRGVEWLAGGSYNLIGVNVAATFCGERDRVAGGYCVIMWEDRTEPILTGREQTGIPKVHAEITDVLTDGERVYVRASKNGRPIVELEVSGLHPLSDEERAAFERGARAGNWMGWRYIPKVGEPGADLSQIIVFPTEPTYHSVERGSGAVRFFPSTFADNPTQYQVINLLCALEPLEYRAAFRTRGSVRLFAHRARVLC
jgi:acetoacetate decarboxylase